MGEARPGAGWATGENEDRVRASADDGTPLRDEAADWLLRLQAAPDDPVARAEFQAWLSTSDSHRRAWQSVQRAWRLSGELALPQQPSPHAALSAVPAKARPRRVRLALGLAVAAVAGMAMFSFAPFLSLWLQADHLTGVAELREITLEDGSVIVLDAGSAIAIRHGAERRAVTLLAGSAFFRVLPARDRPFVVVADDVTVTVTGTAFDVRSGAGGVSVAVQSGTVEVAVAGRVHHADTLAGGERLDVSRATRQVARAEIAPQDVALWRERRVVVDGAPLAEVVDELRRHYGGLIVIRDASLASRRVTGVFDLRHPADALEAIARSQHGSVTRIGQFLLVLSAGS
ncbi:FecR domain-containing protein [soil metagenome]